MVAKVSMKKWPRYQVAEFMNQWAVIESSDQIVSLHPTEAKALAACQTLSDGVDDYSLNAPVSAWFLGPGTENADYFNGWIEHILQDYLHWRQNYFPTDTALIDSGQKRHHQAWNDHFANHMEYLLRKLKAHFPTFSPRYLAHMVSEQSMPGILGYFAALLYNPNNVTSEAAPVTVALEIEVGQLVAKMLGYDPAEAWVHLCSGGTLANLEALWVARTVQLSPLILREFCQFHQVNVPILLGNESVALSNLSDLQAVQLAPDVALGLHSRTLEAVRDQKRIPLEEVYSSWIDFQSASEYNVSRRGLNRVLAKIGLNPLILVSETAHYSFRKAVNLLGLGQDSLCLIPSDDHFRLDLVALREKMFSNCSDEFILAVVGIAGTTEEGSVDPIHSILQLRRELVRRQGRSFWLHVDAAWGGYIRTLFPLDPQSLCAEALIPMDTNPGVRFTSARMYWSDPAVIQSFESMGQADSITVDPHKMGYLPYPAGLIAFKNHLVKNYIRENPPYIDNPDHNDGKVGPYILEGSKPGAAAAACWLAHTTIPLNPSGHGKIVASTIQSSLKLYMLLKEHAQAFLWYEAQTCGAGDTPSFALIPLYAPDTNVVCFVLRPTNSSSASAGLKPISVNDCNQLNQELYSRFSISTEQEQQKLSYLQEFFVSRSILKSQCMKHLAQLLCLCPNELQTRGLFILRSTVMNPFYLLAREKRAAILREFVCSLHSQARQIMIAFAGKTNAI